MREIVSHYLNHEISRRGFMNRLLGLGFSLAGAEAVLAPLDASERAGRNEPDPKGYNIEGTGGALVVEQAGAAGVEYLFTNPGAYETGFFDAFVDTPRMQLIMGLHEGVVTSMADGYARVSGRPGFINVHAIAGPAQMAGQLYNAARDGTPLVVTAGLNDNEAWSDENLLAPRPGFDEKDVNRQFTKICWDARQAASLALMLRRAFKVATTEPGGPVFLAMAHYALEAKGVRAQILPADRFLLRERMRPSTSAVQKAARLLVEAKRPVLVIGDEIWKSGAQREVVALSDQLGLAVLDTRTGYGNFPVQHAHYLGMPGDGVDLDLMKSEFVQRGVDLIVMVGVRDFGGRVIPESPEVPPEARIVRIGIDTASMGRNYPTDVALIGDVKEALIDLQAALDALVTKERLTDVSLSRSQEVRTITSAARAQTEALSRKNFGQNPIHPDELGAVMARTIDKDAIVVRENNTGRHAAFPFGFREDEQMMLATTAGCLGWGIGASIGAKLAAPGRQVVCSIGDGSLMYSAAGFWTQARYGIPVLTVVWNNHNYQVVRWAQDRYKGRIASSRHYPGMYLGDPDIDFVRLAESQGVKGERVTSGSELEPALKRGIAATREGNSYLIDVVIARYGPGADSTWHDTFKLANLRKHSV
jgi:thiamine pyrophosphate-dependent acetolactate synthase large subunit-like protein